MEQEMEKQKVDKVELAERLETSRSALERILDPSAPSTLRTLARAARVIGRGRVRISLV